MKVIELPDGDSMGDHSPGPPEDGGDGFNTAMLKLMVTYHHLPGPAAHRMATTGVQLLTHYVRWAWGIEG